MISIQRGDKIAIVAPAGAIAQEKIEASLSFFKESELEPILGKNLFNKHFKFAGKHELRLDDLQWAINNSEIKAIFCARGGYGCNHIIDKIDFTSLQNNYKPIIGFSDITTIHSALNNQNIPSIHGPMPGTFPSNNKENIENLFKILFNQNYQLQFETHSFNVEGKIEGEIVGGNLSILYSLLGTKNQLITDNKILFIEEIGEHEYHIDRMILAMKQAGLFSNLKGLIIGQFSDTKKDTDNPFGMNSYEIINYHTQEYTYPKIFDFPSGHVDNNHPIILNSTIILNSNKSNCEINFTPNAL